MSYSFDWPEGSSAFDYDFSGGTGNSTGGWASGVLGFLGDGVSFASELFGLGQRFEGIGKDPNDIARQYMLPTQAAPAPAKSSLLNGLNPLYLVAGGLVLVGFVLLIKGGK